MKKRFDFDVALSRAVCLLKKAQKTRSTTSEIGKGISVNKIIKLFLIISFVDCLLKAILVTDALMMELLSI